MTQPFEQYLADEACADSVTNEVQLSGAGASQLRTPVVMA